ncbi:hypothetical protein ACM9HO_15770, partial [Pseudomonas sp. KHB2.9]
MVVVSQVIVDLARLKKKSGRFFCTYKSIMDFSVFSVNRFQAIHARGSGAGGIGFGVSGWRDQRSQVFAKPAL